MEGSIFPTLRDELEKSFVEIRLHNDKQGDEAQRKRSEQIQDLKLRLTQSQASPIYLIVDPEKPDEILDRYDGADLVGNHFRAFIRKYARR